MNALIEKAEAAPTEAAAVKILTEGGYPADLAEQTAAIMFGSLAGDLVEVADDPRETLSR